MAHHLKLKSALLRLVLLFLQLPGYDHFRSLASRTMDDDDAGLNEPLVVEQQALVPAAERRELKQERTWRFSGQIKVRATECSFLPMLTRLLVAIHLAGTASEDPACPAPQAPHHAHFPHRTSGFYSEFKCLVCYLHSFLMLCCTV